MFLEIPTYREFFGAQIQSLLASLILEQLLLQTTKLISANPTFFYTSSCSSYSKLHVGEQLRFGIGRILPSRKLLNKSFEEAVGKENHSQLFSTLKCRGAKTKAVTGQNGIYKTNQLAFHHPYIILTIKFIS